MSIPNTTNDWFSSLRNKQINANITTLTMRNVKNTITQQFFPDKIFESKQSFTLTTIPQNSTEQEKKIVGTIESEFGGGKSGDHPILIKINDIQYVLKIFKLADSNLISTIKKKLNIGTYNTDNKKQLSEIDRHIQFTKLFKNEYVPCPIIYCYGIMTMDNNPYNYFIMEYSNGPELHQFIIDKCTKKSKSTNTLLHNVNMIDIIMELFYIICNMIIINFTHCDFHTKNIIITKSDNTTPLAFNTLFKNGKSYPLSSSFRIKILDFGLSVEGTTIGKNGKHYSLQCEKERDISAALVELREACKGSKRSGTMRLVKGETTGYNGNTDLLFFCNILKALSTSNRGQLQSKWVASIPIDEIREIAGAIILSSDNTERLDLLNQIYIMLTTTIPKNRQCTESELCTQKNTTSSNRTTIIRKRNGNKNAKNITCKKFHICKENTTFSITPITPNSTVSIP